MLKMSMIQTEVYEQYDYHKGEFHFIEPDEIIAQVKELIKSGWRGTRREMARKIFKSDGIPISKISLVRILAEHKNRLPELCVVGLHASAEEGLRSYIYGMPKKGELYYHPSEVTEDPLVRDYRVSSSKFWSASDRHVYLYNAVGYRLPVNWETLGILLGIRTPDIIERLLNSSYGRRNRAYSKNTRGELLINKPKRKFLESYPHRQAAIEV